MTLLAPLLTLLLVGCELQLLVERLFELEGGLVPGGRSVLWPVAVVTTHLAAGPGAVGSARAHGVAPAVTPRPLATLMLRASLPLRLRPSRMTKGRVKK